MLKYIKQKEVKLLNWVLPIPSLLFQQFCKDYHAYEKHQTDSPWQRMHLFTERIQNREWWCRFSHVVSLSTSATIFRDKKTLGIRKDWPLHIVKFKLYAVWLFMWMLTESVHDPNISIWSWYFYSLPLNLNPLLLQLWTSLLTAQDFQQHNHFKIQERHYRSF